MGAYVSAADVKRWANLDSHVSDEDIEEFVIAPVEAALAHSHEAPEDPQDPPADFRQAVVMQCARLLKRRTTPEGVVQFGGEVAIRVTRFDPDIESLLAPYRKWVCA